FRGQLCEPRLARAYDIGCNSALVFDHFVDALFQGPGADKLMNLNRFRLTNAERPIGGLVLHRRIPPAIKMKDVICLGKIQTGAPGFQGKNEDPGSGSSGLKAIHHSSRFFFGTPPCRKSASSPNVSCSNLCSRSPISLNWVKMSARSPEERTSSSISARRAAFPDRPAA